MFDVRRGILTDWANQSILSGIMKINDELLEEIKRFYLEEYKEEISTEEARKRFTRLVNVLRVILRPEAANNKDAING